MIERQFKSINQMMKFASDDHHTLRKKEGSDERDPDYITRISTAEFTFYTAEPLTLSEFEQLQNRIVMQAKQMDKGIHLVLGSFAVLSENKQVINVTPHIICGGPPSVSLLVKNLISPIDVHYKMYDDHGEIKTLPMFDSSCYSSQPLAITIDGKKIVFQFNNIIPCTTPGETPFLTGIDICEDHTEALVQKNAQQLLERDAHLGQQPFSHMVISNSVILIREFCLGAAMHVDPIFSSDSCKIGAKQQEHTMLKQDFANASMHVYTIEPTACFSLLQCGEELKRPLREDIEKNFNILSAMGFGASDMPMQECLSWVREELQRLLLLKNLAV